MRLPALLFASLVLALPAAAQETPPRAMTTDDGLDMVNVGGAVISPDGDWVLYSKSELDWKANKRKTTWWRVSSQGGDPYQYIGEDGGSGFTFSPDGSKIAFTRTVDEKAQLFLLRTAGGEAVKLTDHKSSVGSFEWLEDGSALVFVADEPRTEEEEKARKDGDDAIVVDEGPNGVTADEWSNLWRVDVATGEEKRLTEVDHRVGSFSVSPASSPDAWGH